MRGTSPQTNELIEKNNKLGRLLKNRPRPPRFKRRRWERRDGKKTFMRRSKRPTGIWKILGSMR
jgi:hypothetical protein